MTGNYIAKGQGISISPKAEGGADKKITGQNCLASRFRHSYLTAGFLGFMGLQFPSSINFFSDKICLKSDFGWRSITYLFKMSLALRSASRLKAEVRLAQAVLQYELDLSATQRATFRNQKSRYIASPPELREVMALTAEIDSQYSGKTGGRCLGPRLTNFLLQGIQQFAALGGVVVGGS